jgi:small GTP-binding protein
METMKIRQNDMIHYHKIIIFGEPDVGKTSLISLFEHFDDDSFKIEVDTSRNSSFNEQSSIVEQIKKIHIKLNEDRTLYLNIYETNLNRYDPVKMNLDTLLVQTECIIIMFDNSFKRTFDNLPDLVSTIKTTLKNKIVPIFLLQNKIDLNVNESQLDLEEEFNSNLQNLLNNNQNLIYNKISLLNKDDSINLLLEIDRNIDQDDNNNDIKLKYTISKDISNCQQKITILLLGNRSTGKTTFLNKLMDKDNDSTIEDDYYEILGDIKNEIFKIRINNTARQQTYGNLPNSLYKASHGFLLFFDVTNEESFNSLDNWIQNIKEQSKNYNENNNSIILIANKIDESDNRKIPKNNAKNYAEQNKLKYFECSSKNGLNVLEIFNEIILMTYYMYKEIGDDIESNKINENNKDNKDNKDSEINVNNKDNIDNKDYKYGNKDNIKNEGFEDKRDYSENCIKESVFIMDNEIENDIRKSRQHNIKATKIITKKKGSCCPFVPFFN